jgi:hypothetical protein
MTRPLLPKACGERPETAYSAECPAERTAVGRLYPEARRGRSNASIHRRPPTHFRQFMQWDTTVVSLNCYDDVPRQAGYALPGEPPRWRMIGWGHGTVV